MSEIQRAVDVAGGQQKLAEAAGVSPQAVSFWVTGARLISAEYVLKVEQATAGRVTRYDLRPDIFGEAPVARQSNKAAA